MPTVWASAGSDATSAGAVTAIAAAANQPNSLRRETASDMKTSYSKCRNRVAYPTWQARAWLIGTPRSGEVGQRPSTAPGGGVGQFENSDLVKIHEHDRRSQRAVLLCVSVVNPLPAVAPVDREAGRDHGRKVVIGIFDLGLDGGAGVLFRFDLAANERHIADDASGLIARKAP